MVFTCHRLQEECEEKARGASYGPGARNGERGMKLCEHPECLEMFPTPLGRGRPALYCLEHRKTRYAMIRQRKHPELRLSRIPQHPCCRDAGRKCPQHHQAPPQRMAYRPSKAEQSVISELIDVWGYANILNDRGWTIARPEARE